MLAESIIEAALLIQSQPIDERTLCQLWTPHLSEEELAIILSNIEKRWLDRALRLVKTTQGWRFQVVEQAWVYLNALQEQRAPRYSRAVMETLAVIAYKQPVTRSDIEAIRGVSVSTQVMQTLQERCWIEVVGYRDTIGKPSLWGTTANFLNDFQLKHLDELPPLATLGELTLPDTALFSTDNTEINHDTLGKHRV